MSYKEASTVARSRLFVTHPMGFALNHFVSQFVVLRRPTFLAEILVNARILVPAIRKRDVVLPPRHLGSVQSVLPAFEATPMCASHWQSVGKLMHSRV